MQEENILNLQLEHIGSDIAMGWLWIKATYFDIEAGFQGKIINLLLPPYSNLIMKCQYWGFGTNVGIYGSRAFVIKYVQNPVGFNYVRSR